jgi:hypothetical protein
MALLLGGAVALGLSLAPSLPPRRPGSRKPRAPRPPGWWCAAASFSATEKLSDADLRDLVEFMTIL